MILLLGMGLGNKSVEKFLIKNNIKYCVYDDRNVDKNINILKEKNIKLIIKSNGINNNHLIINEAMKYNIKVISDLQFFYVLTNNENYVLVTGSNGKTTIVTLLEKCLKDTIAIGNNGLPLFDYISDNSYKIIEASSFMLENCQYIKYKYNIISNIYPTHLEHHKTFIQYIKSKLSFLKFLKEEDYVIYDNDDIILRRIINCYNVKKVPVSLYKSDCPLYLNDGYIYYLNNKLLSIKPIKLIGNHNIKNIMLVLGVLLNHELTKQNYLLEIMKFKGVKYRLELIYDKNIKIYNDSKSTNFKALSEALKCFNDSLALIVGGKKRNDDFNLLTKHLYKIEVVYCYGENKYDFFNYFNNNNIKCFVYDNLHDVISNLKFESNILLFSPGSVSYDQFSNFEERGNYFNKLIKNITLIKN